MKLEIEKEVDVDGSTWFNVRVDKSHHKCFRSEAEAHAEIERIKRDGIEPFTEIIYSEDVP